MGWMGWKASKHRAALGGHATDLYAAASVVMFLRPQVLDDDRMFRSIRSGLALYSSPRWLRRQWQVPKGRRCLQKAGIVMTFPPL
jgi:hypothetical protein